MEGKVCTKCKQWKLLEEYYKNKASKDGKTSQCKECINKYPKKVKEVREGMKKCSKCKQWKLLEEFNKKKTSKDGRRPSCKECQRKYHKQWEEINPEYRKQRYQNNKEREKERSRQRYQNNKEHYKEQHKEHDRRYRQTIKQNNLQYISSIVEQINPTFNQLNLPVYGYVYVFENIKTGHKYVGQSTNPISRRYAGGIVRGWIKERLEYDTQKFKNELIETDIVVTETLDVAFCQYHLDKLEAYYIDKYDSCNNGYNNNAGHYNTDDGIEEFNQILSTHNLEYKDGKIIKKPTSTNEID